MLVNCFAYQDGKRLADHVSPADIGGYLSRPECFVWVALKDPEPEEFAGLIREALALVERSRWGTGVLLVMLLTVLACEARLHSLWGAA